MGDLKVHINPVTKALVHFYRPIKLYIYDHGMYPYSQLNPLVKALIYGDSLFRGGEHLFDRCEDPSAADLLHFPCDLDYFEHREEQVRSSLQFYSDNEARHLFYDTRDDPEPFPSAESICLKPSVHKSAVSGSVICIPYMEGVDDFFSYFIQSRTIEYDLSFIGNRTPLREIMVDSLKGLFASCCFLLRDGFFFGGQFPAVEKEQTGLTEFRRGDSEQSWRVEFIEVMRQSRFALALPGYGLNSFRFFEALSLGVPPVLVSEGAALPFENLIDYDRFCIRVRADSPSMPADIKLAIEQISQEKYADMCLLARLHYDAFLSPRHFLFLLYDALRRLI